MARLTCHPKEAKCHSAPVWTCDTVTSPRASRETTQAAVCQLDWVGETGRPGGNLRGQESSVGELPSGRGWACSRDTRVGLWGELGLG